MINYKPAIVAVGYNRPHTLKRLLDSLADAQYEIEDITLVISIDKAQNEKDVKRVADEFEWKHGEKVVRTFEKRQGLRNHIIQCGDLSESYGAVIILEDDILVSKGFYTYVCEALSYYNDVSSITGIALYSHEWNGYAGKFFQPIPDGYDTYLGQFSITWGQCWTWNWWHEFKQWYIKHSDKLAINYEIPQQIFKWSDQSWGKYYVNYIVENDLYYVIPRISLSTNFSELGEHVLEKNTDHQVAVLQGVIHKYRFAPFDDAQKYDIFFENKKIVSCFPENIRKEGITINLTGCDRIYDKNRYILTTIRLPYKKIKSYGMVLRPIENNIIYNIKGRDICLYDKMMKGKNVSENTYINTRYEIRGISNKQLLHYIVLVIKKKLFFGFKRI